MIYWIVRTLLFPVFFRRLARVEGSEHLPKDGSFLLAANHVDYLDGFFLTVAVVKHHRRRIRFLSETNNYWWTGGATIQVNEDDKAGSVTRAAASLANGDIICFFVEARRNPDPVLARPKTGLARLAITTNTVVVPIGIVGHSGTSFWNSIWRAFTGKRAIIVRIGKPLTLTTPMPQDSTEADLHRQMDRVMVALAPLAQKQYFPSP